MTCLRRGSTSVENKIPASTNSMKTYRANVSALFANNSYVYSLLNMSAGIIASGSDNCIRGFDRNSLQCLWQVRNAHHESITAIKAVDQFIVLSCGKDSTVKFWDTRTDGKSAVREFFADSTPFLCADYDEATGRVAVGTELVKSNAAVLIWDARTSLPLVSYAESHNDDITDIHFSRFNSSHLITGSCDGLVNIFDTQVIDEDDAVCQVANHSASIHCADFLSGEYIFALSHMETMTIFPLTTSESDDRPAIELGDLRVGLECDYVIDVLRLRSGIPVIAKAINGGDAEVAIMSDTMMAFDEKKRRKLIGGHGEHVIRALLIFEENKVYYTGGEDGMIKLWSRCSN
ncbi:putative WD repeat-containing protein [Neolecta irregularis DAH-3]|uniref:Putative WD repeat-containing protein n=1 Tax=Neolecta irregularis (strain DAH-3) TaxID=1198029 RepID=A0A1U7LWU1_NEOID|nr:putative WD repeat-containing protein [Neolecta irregularis DAH-3]|eukprot:OLL27146.1 putative WD repeat-containing protein [Neolecta irregularis DAH-3]